MTQASDHKPLSTHRRSARNARTRPTLVAPTTSQDNANAAEDASNIENVSAIVEQSPVQGQSSTTLEAPRKASGLKLPKFFSTVGKSEQAPAEQESTVARARLARATRGKLNSAPAKPADEAPPQARKADARPAAPARPARPASPFKTRYLIGMGLYLIGANFIGIFITSFFQSRGIDSILTHFAFFGATIVIRTSTLVYLATLVILLVLLARLDLIPRSFSSLSGQSSAGRGGRGGASKSNSNSSENARSAPPTMKQGVKGASDDLYQQYRANQRRERKK